MLAFICNHRYNPRFQEPSGVKGMPCRFKMLAVLVGNPMILTKTGKISEDF